MQIHILHIGKTGGTAIKTGMRSSGVPDSVLLLRHRHLLDQIPAGNPVVFAVRDPISRFMSAFYSRLRQGAPRYRSEWRPAERIAFERFPTPQALVEGLLAGQTEARVAMRKIRHVRHPQSRWLRSSEYLEERLDDIVYIARQETLDEDWEHLKPLLGLPREASLPRRAHRAHRAPPGEDRTLSREGREFLGRKFATDYGILDFADRLRRERGWGVGVRPV